ncbi:MAG: gliding motility-associated C-terminal domain-containing protein, partial [Saprospiraceae bacterium]|nr:gliding motility-associated C-terminal domain-containing protein [Saprospiraceae bacterium]MCC6279584.1 gliding motility-associated C-terminal domain-containing protein [Saprospiraceae bacterium]
NIVQGGQSLIPTVNQSGLYILTVLSTGNGCTDTASVQVQTSQQYPVADAGLPQVLTCDVEELILDASGSSQGSSLAYIWDSPDGNILSGGNTLQPLINAPGTYNLSIVNQDNGCASAASVLVGTDYIAPDAMVAPGGVLSCTVANLSLNGTGSSVGGQFAYNWLTQNGNVLSGENTLQPQINAVGAYTLIVTNTQNGCTSTASTTVMADASLPVANAGTPDTLTCAVNSIVLNATASSQGAGYAYSWAGPGNVAASTNLQPVVDEPGDYSLTVTNVANGCTAISTVAIVEDIAIPVAIAGPADELTCTKTVIALDGSASSTGPLFQYVWTASNGGQITGGANTPVPTIDEPGDYQLVVTNTFNQCQATDAVAITQDVVVPAVEAGPQSTLTCVIPSVTLSGQGNTDTLFAYTWTTLDGNIASGDSTLSPVVDAPGTYNILVTNTYNGCTSTDQVLIDRDANVPDAIAEVTGELNCVTNSLQLSGLNSSQGPTLTYTWETTNGHIVAGENTTTPIVDEPGQYTLQVYNTANSCVALSTISVNENLTLPQADAGAPAVLSCAHPVLTLDGAGSSTGNQYKYLWDTQDGNILLGDTILQPQVDQSGYYTLVVTDESNGCTAESTVQILLDVNTPEADAGISPTLTCDVTALNLNASSSSIGAQFSYQWSTLDGQIVAGDTTLTPNISAPGTYALVVTNVNNGCSSDATVLVNQDIEPPVAAAGHESVLTCTVLTTNLNVNGSSTGADFSYHWDTPNGLILSGADTPTPSVGDPGVYDLMVRNLLTGCTNTASVTVPEDVEPPVSASAVGGELTCAIQTLPLNNIGSSSGAQFVYQWGTSDGNIVSGTTGASPTVDEPGEYTLVVTNNINGCTSSSTVAVPQNITPPVVDATVSSLLTCVVTQIQLQGSATGGTQGVSYAWTGPGTVSDAYTPNPTVYTIGQYTLTATDLYNGCVASDPVLVSNDVVAPDIVIATPAQLNCYVTQTSLSGAGSSTGGQYSYSWTGPGIVLGANTLSPAVNEPGLYNLLITNTSNGCISSLGTSVTQDIQAPVAQAGGAFELTCSVTAGTLNTSGSTAGNGINYVWSTSNGHIVAGNNSPTPTVDEPGLYALTVINAQTGCTNTASVAVTENTNYPSSLVLSKVLPKCGGQPGALVIETVSGGVGPYLYSIDGGDNFLTANAFEGLVPGTYDMVVQDVNGCEYEQSLIFPVPVEPQVSLIPELTLTYGQDAKLTAALNIPLNQVDTVIWEPMESLTPTAKMNEVIARPFKDTEYTVRIINIDGCEDVAKILVRVKDPQIWAPNIFSPHRVDGNSDFFLIFAADRTINKINTLQIYDRWGTMVFRRDDMQPNDETLGWDGSFRGNMLNPAVFVWWADVELADGSRILLKGDVTIAD